MNYGRAAEEQRETKQLSQVYELTAGTVGDEVLPGTGSASGSKALQQEVQRV